MGRATSRGNEAKSKIKHFIYAHGEIRTQLVVICDPTRNQLENGGALRDIWTKFCLTNSTIVNDSI